MNELYIPGEFIVDFFMKKLPRAPKKVNKINRK